MPAERRCAGDPAAIDQAAQLGGPAAGGAPADGRLPDRPDARHPAGVATCNWWATAPARSPRGWSGPGRRRRVCCVIDGPSQATLRDLQIHAGAARALLVEMPDQPGRPIFADQLNTNGPSGSGRAAPRRCASRL